MRNAAHRVPVEVKSMLSTSSSGRGLSQLRLERRMDRDGHGWGNGEWRRTADCIEYAEESKRDLWLPLEDKLNFLRGEGAVEEHYLINQAIKTSPHLGRLGIDEINADGQIM